MQPDIERGGLAPRPPDPADTDLLAAGKIIRLAVVAVTELVDHVGQIGISARREQPECAAGARQDKTRAWRVKVTGEFAGVRGILREAIDVTDIDRGGQAERDRGVVVITSLRIGDAEGQPPVHRFAKIDAVARRPHLGRIGVQRDPARQHGREILTGVAIAGIDQSRAVDPSRQEIRIQRQRKGRLDEMHHDRAIVAIRPLAARDLGIEISDFRELGMQCAQRAHFDHVHILFEQALLEFGGVTDAPDHPDFVGAGANRRHQVAIANPDRVGPGLLLVAHRRRHQRQRDAGQQ